jgi:hypothetical protein
MARANAAIPGPGGKKKVVAPKPGSAAYWAKYGAGTAQGIGAAPLIPGQRPAKNVVVAGTRAAPFYVDPGLGAAYGTGPKPKPAPAPGPTTQPGGTTTTTTAPPATTPRSPWQDYLDTIDAREKAQFAAQRADAEARAKRYQEALAGFGQALQGNAATEWAKIIGAYGQAGQAATAYGSALASDYGQGLADANRGLAADWSAIGQAGAPIRDDAAAIEQIRTQGGARPDEMAGLVGRAWGSYGETRPGSIGFMTEQDIGQAQRTALDDQAKINIDERAALADNPQVAQQLYQAQEELTMAKTKAAADAAQTKIDNARNALNDKRQQQAWEMTLAKYNQGVAKQLTDQTGYVHRVDAHGNVVNTKTRTADWVQNQAKIRETNRNNLAKADAATVRVKQTKRANDIREEQNIWKRNHPGGKAGKTMGDAARMKYENQFGIDAAAMGMRLLGVKNFNQVPAAGKVMAKADMVKKVYAWLAPQMLHYGEKSWSPAFLKSLVNKEIERMPKNWWSKGGPTKGHGQPKKPTSTKKSGGPPGL